MWFNSNQLVEITSRLHWNQRLELGVGLAFKTDTFKLLEIKRIDGWWLGL